MAFVIASEMKYPIVAIVTNQKFVAIQTSVLVFDKINKKGKVMELKYVNMVKVWV